MVEPNFTLNNEAFALSPMVLHASTDPGKSLTLTVRETFGAQKMIRVTLTADVNGDVVYDVSPLARTILGERFRRENLKVEEQSPYGEYLTISLSNTYAVMNKVLWARAETALVKAIGIDVGKQNDTWLLPTGRYVYRKDAPVGMITGYGGDLDFGLYARNKHTGAVTELTDYYLIYDGVYNYSDIIFSTLPAGEYHVFINQNKPDYMAFDLRVEDCFPADAVAEGAMAYVRYCNAWGGISYAILQVTQRSVKNKNTYVQKEFALDVTGGGYFRKAPDRLMTGQEITPSFKAGTDRLSRAELEELQGILVSPMVDRYDANTGEWVPVYPGDATVTETNRALHEITIEFAENTEGF